MNRICLAIILAGVALRAASAQRLDGCVHHDATVTTVHAPSGQALDRGLSDSGVASTRNALDVALDDPRPDVRSLAALKLAQVGTHADLDKLMQSWLSESDTCTKSSMGLALQVMVPELEFDAERHPGGQRWITPFQACAPSYPETVKLTVEQDTPSGTHTSVVRITARNETQRTLAFLKAPPQELFSVSVLGPGGAPAKFAEGRQRMFEPVGPHSLDLGIGKAPMFIVLPPQEDVPVSTWGVGDDFDVSIPGTYLISLGGRIPYLDAVVCSNAAEVKVGN